MNKLPPLWKKKELADENVDTINKSDYIIDPNGLQVVMQYVVQNLNKVCDNFASLTRELSALSERVGDKDIEQQINDCVRSLSVRIRPLPDEDTDYDTDDSRSVSDSLNPDDYKYDEMKLQIDELKNRCVELDERIIALESYSRRDCLIISGIPSRIKDDALETEVLNALHHLGVKNINRKEVIAVHRLPKRQDSPYPPRVIAKFVNRKIVEKSLMLSKAGEWKKVRTEMGYGLRFYSCISPKNEVVLRNCKSLKEDGSIYDYFIRNGYVLIVENEGDKPFKILSPSRLENKFEG